jgi:hypothetical protein
MRPRPSSDGIALMLRSALADVSAAASSDSGTVILASLSDAVETLELLADAGSPEGTEALAFARAELTRFFGE